MSLLRISITAQGIITVPVPKTGRKSRKAIPSATSGAYLTFQTNSPITSIT